MLFRLVASLLGRGVSSYCVNGSADVAAIT